MCLRFSSKSTLFIVFLSLLSPVLLLHMFGVECVNNNFEFPAKLNDSFKFTFPFSMTTKASFAFLPSTGSHFCRRMRICAMSISINYANCIVERQFFG